MHFNKCRSKSVFLNCQLRMTSKGAHSSSTCIGQQQTSGAEDSINMHTVFECKRQSESGTALQFKSIGPIALNGTPCLRGPCIRVKIKYIFLLNHFTVTNTSYFVTIGISSPRESISAPQPHEYQGNPISAVPS